MAKIPSHLDFSFKSLFIRSPLSRKEKRGRQYIPLAQRKYPGAEKFVSLKEGKVCYIDQGQGRPLVFVHGLSGNLTWWSTLIPKFSKKYRVIAVDLPGHGKSGKTFKSYRLHDLAEYLWELLESLSLQDPVLVGYSMGGALTLKCLADHPKKIKDAILIAPAGVRKPHPLWQRLIARTTLNLPLLKRYLFPRAMASSVKERPEEILQIIYNSMHITKDPEWKEFQEVVMTTTKDLLSFSVQDRLHHIQTRLLAVWGAEDFLEPAVLADILRKKKADVEVTVIPGCGHQPMFERPDVLIEAMDRFLSSQ